MKHKVDRQELPQLSGGNSTSLVPYGEQADGASPQANAAIEAAVNHKINDITSQLTKQQNMVMYQAKQISNHRQVK